MRVFFYYDLLRMDKGMSSTRDAQHVYLIGVAVITDTKN